MQAVEQRVCGLVRDNVVRKCAKHHSVRQPETRVRLGRLEIAEQKRLAIGAVESVLSPQHVWIDTEPLHILAMPVSVLILKPMRRPQRYATKRLLEIFDRS